MGCRLNWSIQSSSDCSGLNFKDIAAFAEM